MRRRGIALGLVTALVSSLAVLTGGASVAAADTPVSVETETLTSDEAAPDQNVQDEAPSEDATDAEAQPLVEVTEEDTSEEAAPEETVPEETAPEETAPEETAPEEAAPEETAPEQDAPDEAVVEEESDEPAPDEEAAEETAEQAAPQDEGSTENSRDGPASDEAVDDSSDAKNDVMAAAGTPVYEIEGDWVNPPPTIARGTPVVGEWRVNINDAEEPPSNDPVDNVVATFTVEKAFFDEIPDLCLTEGVDPASSISEDGTELTCNFGPVNMGTAIVVQTPVVANGVTGDEIVLDGTSPGDETVELDPIEIVNPFLMDIQWGGVTDFEQWDDIFDPTYVDVDLEWSVRLGEGSDPGPDEPIKYRLNVVATDVNNVPQAVEVGFHPSDRGQPDNYNKEGCTSYDFGGGHGAAGHPYSSVPDHAQHTNFVETCTLTQVGPNAFDLTLDGINYDLQNVPELDSQGNPLPPNWNYVASGTVWFRVHTSQPGSVRLSIPNPPTYEAPTGQQYPDLPGNNTTNKAYTLPGGWSSGWQRGWTRSGGTVWDDSFRVPAGTTVSAFTNNTGGVVDAAPGSDWGNCIAFDTAFVTYHEYITDDRPNFAGQIRGYPAAGQENPGPPYTLDNPPPIQYYTGAINNPNTFDCGSGGWSTTPPADLADVTAIRIVHDHSLYAAEDWAGFQLQALVTINDNVEPGQDVWTFGSALRNGTWIGVGEPWESRVITPTPDARYDHTNGRRDIVRIVLADPHIRKEAAQATVTPGVPADFTLIYSATGSGLIPDTVDGYRIVDTLPVGMSYVDGSADPAPVVSVDAQGRQVLTWTFDGVETNVEHELAYQAVVDSSVDPGTTLTNTAQSSLAGEDSAPVTETVTTTNNGYTMILKTSDVEYIPNINGDGVGQGSWTVAIESHDPIAQAFTDTIDILPYNGDGRGTSYSGTYTLDEVVTPDGGTVYYTDADPSTLSDDPMDESNGAPGDPTGNTVDWTTERPENPTAIRVIGGELESGGTFSFQVVISTDGAVAQDVYVNRAQARAEHTDLVMRTSAALVVTDYSVAKTSDPEPGSVVAPGDVVTYTVTVTQEGEVPAGAIFRDDLSDVLDDAIYNDDVAASIGAATIEDGVLYWEGEIPVGEVATVTYSLTVKDIEGLEADGDTILDNSVWSPGCPAPVEGEENPCEPPEILVGWYEYSKTSDPAPGSTVQTGDVVTYNVEIVQYGAGAIENARLGDDLTAVLDDAEWNDDVEVTQGEVTYEEPNLNWSGTLEPDDVVLLSYSVTVNDDGDFELANVVTNDDPTRSRCVPAPDENPDCQTSHIMGDYEVVKTSDPVSGESVEVGDVVTYTVSVNHIGKAPIAASFEDDLSAVLDDATYNDDAEASAGETSYAEPTLTWNGDLEFGDEVTVTYSVTVTAEGDRHLVNVVTTPGVCLPAEGQDEACTTEHFNGAYVYSKTSDPESGSEVNEGDVVTYTVLVEHVGTAPVEDATVTDDLSEVSDVASWNDDAAASSGELSRDGDQLTWTGDLEVDQVVTLTYSVTVGDEPDATMRNVVTSDDERALCVDAEDGNAGCKTDHHTPSAPPPGDEPDSPLPDTGSDVTTMVLLVGMALLIGGLGLMASTRRRARTAADQEAGFDDLL